MDAECLSELVSWFFIVVLSLIVNCAKRSIYTEGQGKSGAIGVQPGLPPHPAGTSNIRPASLPLPARDERGEGRGEGRSTTAARFLGGSSPLPSPHSFVVG